jgi:hypothetical protein
MYIKSLLKFSKTLCQNGGLSNYVQLLKADG